MVSYFSEAGQLCHKHCRPGCRQAAVLAERKVAAEPADMAAAAEPAAGNSAVAELVESAAEPAARNSAVVESAAAVSAALGQGSHDCHTRYKISHYLEVDFRMYYKT